MLHHQIKIYSVFCSNLNRLCKVLHGPVITDSIQVTALILYTSCWLADLIVHGDPKLCSAWHSLLQVQAAQLSSSPYDEGVLEQNYSSSSGQALRASKYTLHSHLLPRATADECCVRHLATKAACLTANWHMSVWSQQNTWPAAYSFSHPPTVYTTTRTV